MHTTKQFLTLLILLLTCINQLTSQQTYLQHWIPDNIGDQYQVLESHDYDLMRDENVTFHFKADYLLHEEIHAEILAVQTINQCYKGSHNYKLRSDRTTLVDQDVFIVDDYKLFITKYKDPLSNIFYTCQFSMIETGNLRYQLFNPWVDSEYVSQYRILNFYIKSKDTNVLNILIDKVVDKFSKQAEVLQSNVLSLQPSLLVKQAKYSMGKLKLVIDNNGMTNRNISLNVMAKDSELDSREELLFDLKIRNGIDEYEITDIYLFDAEVHIMEEDKLIDRFFIKDGEWTIENPNDAFLFNVLSEERVDNSEGFKIEREVISVARLYNEITVQKELSPNGYPADISSYNGFSFYQVGIDELDIEFYFNNELIRKFHITSNEAYNAFTMDLNDCLNITHIKLILKSYDLAEPMRISKMEFFKSLIISSTQTLNELSLSAYPNPCLDKLSINLVNHELLGAAYKIIDSSGYLISSGEFSDLRFDVDTSDYISGHYYLVCQNNKSDVLNFAFIKR